METSCSSGRAGARLIGWLAAALATFPVGLTAARPAAERVEAVNPPSNLRLFLLIGQSNMVGRGKIEPQDAEPHPRILSLDADRRWVRAADPLQPGAGVSLATSFARSLVAADPAAMIGLVPCAQGSTQLDLWQPGTPLYANAVTRTRIALQHGRLAGILWHQGEGDSARQLEATYAERFAGMIAQLRRDLDAPDTPVIVGELGAFWRAPEPMNQVLRELPALVPKSACASSAGLTDKGDRIHFDSESLREFGRRYAAAYLQLAAQASAAAP